MFSKSKEAFLAQSYKDANDDYSISVNSNSSQRWDWVVITASNDFQADAYRLQLKKREKEGMLPRVTRFAVVADAGGVRAGSGGATLIALKHIADSDKRAINSLKICIIHSGGDSKRIPQYSACGKLFMPIPRILSSGRISSLFDELLISVSGIPARMSSGLLIMPGDTMLLFTPLQLDLDLFDAAGISIKTDIKTGQEHGVFKEDEDGRVSRFLHKQTEAVLRAEGAVDSNAQVNVDTGVIWLSGAVSGAIFNLICDENGANEAIFYEFVNPKLRLSFYADFLFPLAKDITLEEYYAQIPEGIFSNELKERRTEIWNKLHNYTLSLVKLNPSKYIHFGTTWENFDFFTKELNNFRFIGWRPRNVLNVDCPPSTEAAITNSFVDSSVYLTRCLIEDSRIGSGVDIGGNNVLSGIDAEDVEIPKDTVLHCLKLKNGKYVCRIYGINDNPKSSIDGTYLGGSIRKALKRYGLNKSVVCNSKMTVSIWNAKLFVEHITPEGALASALLLYKIIEGKASENEVSEWVSSPRHSLESSFNDADVLEIIARQEQLSSYIRLDNFVKQIASGKPQADVLDAIFSSEDASKLLLMAQKAKFPNNTRLYLAISEYCRKYCKKINDLDWEGFENLAYEAIKNTIVDADRLFFPLISPDFTLCKNEAECNLPVRVNFCGSPSDAAPYCLEHGGTMLDGAVLLKKELPIWARAKKLDEPVIIFESLDLNVRKIFTDVEEVLSCGNPFDTFAIHKAVYCSIFNEKSISGGLYLTTRANVPKGSGLGTSSIIAAACVKAIFDLLGVEVADDVIYSKVFAVEQLMGTGGGWQDQVGGFSPGLKYFRSFPGSYQKIEIEHLVISKETQAELQERFVLVFSGQRRLARNVLREETNSLIRNDRAALAAVERIRQLCALMKFELERGNVTGFAHHITEQFALVKTLDSGASNACIEYIFDVCEDIIDGKSICGAGGGGFLQIILKKGVTKSDLEERLNKLFSGSGGVQIWDSELML